MSSISNSKGLAILVIGDLITYVFSLILTLAIRYGQIPTRTLMYVHLVSFSILIALFLLVNLSAGLYEKQFSMIRGRGYGLLIRAQIASAIVGVIFFYFAPVVIAPKANLFIYFIVSTLALFLWRIIVYPVVSVTKQQTAILVGTGEDVDDLREEVNSHGRYAIYLKETLAPASSSEETVSAIAAAVERTGATIVVVDLNNPAIDQAMPLLYKMIFSGVQIIDAGRLYEAVFDRVPLSLVGERWFVDNSSTALGNRKVYDTVKRIIDIVVAALTGLISLIFYPFVFLAILLDDKGSFFIKQQRIGRNGKIIEIIKFRSMSGNDNGQYGKDGNTKLTVTRVGKFIRSSRIDELPQLWNVLKGDLSLVGPRPEIPTLTKVYDNEIPYYNARHLVKPGLTGWAQIYHQAHPHHAVATEDTRDKLTYDLYYIKNRSLALDAKIVVRTAQVLLKRVGR